VSLVTFGPSPLASRRFNVAYEIPRIDAASLTDLTQFRLSLVFMLASR
jgi:hypothetical protein